MVGLSATAGGLVAMFTHPLSSCPSPKRMPPRPHPVPHAHAVPAPPLDRRSPQSAPLPAHCTCVFIFDCQQSEAKCRCFLLGSGDRSLLFVPSAASDASAMGKGII